MIVLTECQRAFELAVEVDNLDLSKDNNGDYPHPITSEYYQSFERGWREAITKHRLIN